MTPTDLAGLCERLRELDTDLGHAVWDRGCQSCALASNTITEAAAAIESLVAALEPFAAMATTGDQRPKDDAVWAGQDVKRITYGDFRRARTALEGASDDR